jgi:putative Mn2+ efflux pump MntP
MFALIVLSCSVAADATAVAIAASIRRITLSRAMAMALLFGTAQTLMAGIGWLGGAFLGEVWSAWDHWIAFALLSAVGVKMIKEAFTEENERASVAGGIGTLLLLSIATSIDALAVGVTLPSLELPATLALAMIGTVTFALSAAGAAFGHFLGARFGRAIEVAGGVGLIAIGVKIVLDHVR